MDKPKFYIFGVPDGFDILDGSSQEISYFQRFYDSSTEDTKFTMHRDLNGNVTYSFLKYNLSSGKSRTGSFFGMSLAYSGYYCIHPLKLYDLFDYVYQNHVLCNTLDVSTGILRPIANSDIKAQYLITRFEDKKEHIKFIEKVLQRNLETNDVLASSFYPLDPGFKNENLNLVVKMPLVEEFEDDKQKDFYRGHFEESLIGRFREYGYVTISPDWKPVVEPGSKKESEEPIIEISPQTIVYWKELIPNYQRYIIQRLGNLTNTNMEEVGKYLKQIEEEVLKPLKVHSYNKNIAPSLKTDYEELCNQLADLYQKVVKKNGEGTERWATPQQPPVVPPTPSFWNKVKHWTSKKKGNAAVIVGTIAAIVVILVLLRPKNPGGNPTPTHTYCCAVKVDELINNALSENDFGTAFEIVDTISDENFQKQKIETINGKLSQFHSSLDQQIRSHKSQNKWSEAFAIAEGYYGEDTKNTKLGELQVECSSYFNTRIGMINKDNYTTESSTLKQELDNVESYIGKEKYDSFIRDLDKKRPSDDLIRKTAYKVELWKGDRQLYPTLKMNHNSNISEGKILIEESQEINVDNTFGIIFRLINEKSKPMPLSLSDITYVGVQCESKTSGWIDVTSIENNATITIKKADIVITFKKVQ